MFVSCHLLAFSFLAFFGLFASIQERDRMINIYKKKLQQQKPIQSIHRLPKLKTKANFLRQRKQKTECINFVRPSVARAQIPGQMVFILNEKPLKIVIKWIFWSYLATFHGLKVSIFGNSVPKISTIRGLQTGSP